MDYTSNVADPKQRPDQFEWLKIYLERAKVENKPVYVLAMSRENYSNPERMLDKLAKIPGVFAALHLNATIDCVTSASKEEAEKLAKEVHTLTGEIIAGVEYDGENMMSFYITISEAISIAREKKEPWYIYDKKVDSLSALIEKVKSD